MRRKALLILGLSAFSFLGHQQVQATLAAENKDENTTSSSSKFSEADIYLDLNTGKTFQVIYDGLNELYNRSDLFAFDLFVNTRTKDTLWLEDAILVNNALVRDASGKFKVDPMKVKRDGNSYKVKSGLLAQ
jgi:hypothetical protein